MSDDNGEMSVKEKFLNTGDLFGLEYNRGYVFFEITGWEQYKFEPFNGFSEISGSSSTGFQRLDYNNDDILYVEKEDKKILHVGIAHSPAWLERFTNYPEGTNRLRSIPNLPIPTPADPYGYIDGTDSPYEEPTDAEELFVPPGVHLDFNLYNPRSEAADPSLNVVYREYEVDPLSPGNESDARAIGKVIRPGSPIPIAPVGSIDRQTDYNMENEWKVTPITRSEAKNVGGI